MSRVQEKSLGKRSDREMGTERVGGVCPLWGFGGHGERSEPGGETPAPSEKQLRPAPAPGVRPPYFSP